MSVLPTPAKIALIVVGGVAVLSFKYVIGHAFTVLVLAAVVTAIVAVVSSRKRSNLDNIQVSESDSDHVVHMLGHGVRFGQVRGTNLSENRNVAGSRHVIADAVRRH